MKKVLFAGAVLLTGTLALNAQKVTKYTTTEKAPWVMSKAALATKAEGKVVVSVGDLGLKHFNIERDKRNIIPLARAAQKYCPQLKSD